MGRDTITVVWTQKGIPPATAVAVHSWGEARPLDLVASTAPATVAVRGLRLGPTWADAGAEVTSAPAVVEGTHCPPGSQVTLTAGGSCWAP